MDVEKLSNIIIDLDNDERNKQISDYINNLIEYINANDSKGIADTVSKMDELRNNSPVDKYTPSNQQIVEQIGAAPYFGNGAIDSIQTILRNNPYNVQAIVAELNKYKNLRNDYLDVQSILNINLTKINIDAHYHSDYVFEVGLLMPHTLTNDKIKNVTRALNQWDKIFKTLKELVGEAPEDTELNYISNGSLQFFIDNSPTVAVCLSVLVERVIKIYKNIVEIRSVKSKLKELGVPEEEKLVAEEKEKNILQSNFDQLAETIVKDFATAQIETGRLNELKIAVRGHVSYVAKQIDQGLTIEIIPPEISEPKNKEKEGKSDEEKKAIMDKYEKALKSISIVEKSMEIIKAVGKSGWDITKLLNNPEEDSIGDDAQ